jgi:putative FmdB family regulatory protein
MPIYEYQCLACGELTEALQKMSDAPLTVCPSCGEAALKKKISAAAFRLKGGGWYETDFKSGNKKNLAGESGTGDGKSDGGEKKAGAGAGDSAGSSAGGKNESGASAGATKTGATTGKSADS